MASGEKFWTSSVLIKDPDRIMEQVAETLGIEITPLEREEQAAV